MAEAYGREDVRRMLDVSERQLKGWEKQGFIPANATFGFDDLLALKTLKKLREFHIAPVQIQRAILSLKTKLADIERPLAQLRITAEGKSIAVHVGESRMEPITGQLLLDFDRKEIEKLRSFPVKAAAKNPAEDNAKEREAELWFQRGLALEETGAQPLEAYKAYKRATEINPKAAGALVNLGTIAFRMRRFAEAETYYKQAIDSDPTYSLAHFNIGNLHDEQGQLEKARVHYLEAIRLSPRYADAFFNMALLCERSGELLQAISYWQKYLALDGTSAWAASARKQLDRLKRSVRSK